MERIMQDAWRDPSIWTEESIRKAIGGLLVHDVSMYRTMAKNSTVRPGMLESASHHRVSMEVVRELLTHVSLPGDGATLDEMLQLSRRPDHFQQLSDVLRAFERDRGAVINWNHAFQTAARRGWDNVVARYLTDFPVDPAADNNRAIRLAAGHGDGERADQVSSTSHCETAKVIRRLLNCERVDPTAGDNRALYLAASHGLDDNVRELLLDVRVREGNLGPALVASVEFPAILQALLEHPTAWKDRSAALHAAAQAHHPPLPASINILRASLPCACTQPRTCSNRRRTRQQPGIQHQSI
jgi:hypothetical protein